MPIQKILFYTQPYFLDNALEYIEMLTNLSFQVDVIINMAPNQLKSTVFNLDLDLTAYEGLQSFESIKDEWNLQYLESYLDKCTSVYFAVFSSKKLTKTIQISQQIRKHIISINPVIIHLDEVSNRHLFLFPFFLRKRKKIVLNIHDPELHSGEDDKIRIWSRKLLFSSFSQFVVFSKHGQELLRPQLSSKKRITILNLMPYTIYSKFLNDRVVETSKKSISFVGRISPYKGVELFAEAADLVHQQYPSQKFVIGGKPIGGYNPDFLTKPKEHLEIRNKFLSIHEMASLINESQLIVCPYIDATQSGVILTAYGLGCPVLVTKTGGLPEYVKSNKTGLIAKDTTANAIANSIIEFIKNDLGMNMLQKTVVRENLSNYRTENSTTVIKLYEQFLS